MKYVFLLNWFTLRDDTTKVIEQIQKVAKSMNLDYRLEINSPYRSVEKILDTYKDGGYTIISVGGDGSINRTLNNIVGTNNTLGYIPYGTGNDFYRTNRLLFESGVHPMDIVKINDNYFINVACFGIDADIANDQTKSKVLPTSQKYTAGLIKHFSDYTPRYLKVEANGEKQEQFFTTVALCNGRYYGGGYKVGPYALPDDGLLDVYLVDAVSKLKMAKLIMDSKKGAHENSKSVRVIQAKKVFIESPKEITCNIDGEPLTASKFDIEVIHNGIDVYYNQDLIDEVLKVRKSK